MKALGQILSHNYLELNLLSRQCLLPERKETTEAFTAHSNEEGGGVEDARIED
jgi:hypothetical protein